MERIAFRVTGGIFSMRFMPMNPEQPPSSRTAWEALAEQHKDDIQTIADLRLGSDPRANILLVLLGEKPAAEVDVSSYNDAPEKVAEVFERAGLMTFAEPRPDKERITRITVARDAETLERIRNAEADRDHEEYGRLMGYPESAIQAFGDNDATLEESPRDIEPSIIFSMKLSKAHAKEELALLKRWSDIIKTVAPDFYEKARPKPDTGEGR